MSCYDQANHAGTVHPTPVANPISTKRHSRVRPCHMPTSPLLPVSPKPFTWLVRCTQYPGSADLCVGYHTTAHTLSQQLRLTLLCVRILLLFWLMNPPLMVPLCRMTSPSSVMPSTGAPLACTASMTARSLHTTNLPNTCSSLSTQPYDLGELDSQLSRTAHGLCLVASPLVTVVISLSLFANSTPAMHCTHAHWAVS